MLSATNPPAIVVYVENRVRTREEREFHRLMMELEREDKLRKKIEREKREQFEKTHCSYCRRPEIVSRNLRLCGECTQARNQELHEEVTEVKPLDAAQGQQALDKHGLCNCPLCGVLIHKDRFACQRHMTTVLMRLMRGRKVG